jgi:hypothetical protein
MSVAHAHHFVDDDRARISRVLSALPAVAATAPTTKRRDDRNFGPSRRRRSAGPGDARRIPPCRARRKESRHNALANASETTAIMRLTLTTRVRDLIVHGASARNVE